jgi:hypothetical protein
MTSRFRTFPWLVATVLAGLATPSKGQDTPLYRDPSPTEGPRIVGPLLPSLPPRPTSIPAPPSGLGPFQPTNPNSTDPTIAPPGEPLLAIPPIAPPLPAMPMPPFAVVNDVQIKRKTTIRGPRGVLGQCHEWFHAVFFGSHKTLGDPTVPKRSFFERSFHSTTTTEAEAQPRLFNWPSWPVWPLSDDH